VQLVAGCLLFVRGSSFVLVGRDQLNYALNNIGGRIGLARRLRRSIGADKYMNDCLRPSTDKTLGAYSSKLYSRAFEDVAS
jgi:hypothetical protein